jgi:nucleoside-diphosphate-sugar epimerase
MNLPKNSRIAITGGTGFLGSHIIRYFIQEGYTNITALKRENSNMTLVSDFQDKVVWLNGDILDIECLYELLDNVDFVVHSAAMVSYDPLDREEIFNVNVEGTANVVNVCLEKNPRKLIFMSSVAAIGRVKSNQLIDEKTEWNESKFNTHYGQSKRLAELEIWRGMAEGLKVGILNPSIILGPSIWGDSSTKVLTHVFKGSKLYPPGTNGFVDVRDVAKLTLHLLESDVINERYLAVSEMLSYKNLFQLIAEEFSIKPPHIEITGFLSGLAWRFYTLKRLLFGTRPAITEETVRITSGEFLYDNSKSKEQFQFEYRIIKETIRDTVSKYKSSKEKNLNFAFFTKF